jgi:hypothetical protein
MLGPIGSTLMSIMKVLTPAEIDMYSESSSTSGSVTQATAVGAEHIQYDYSSNHLKQSYEDQLNQDANSQQQPQEQEQKAKIIPINKKVKEQIEEQSQGEDRSQESRDSKLPMKSKSQMMVSSHDENNELNSIGIYSSQQIQDHEKQLQEQEAKKKDSTSVFILNQRERLKSSRSKMVEQKGIMQYQKSSTADLITKEYTEEDLEDDADMRDSNSKGILLNKKHF